VCGEKELRAVWKEETSKSWIAHVKERRLKMTAPIEEPRHIEIQVVGDSFW
jgi:acetyl/propionyl-CoA carboxylase alpha subunit